QRQAAVAARRTDARIAPAFFLREEMRREIVIERVDDLRDLKVLGVADGFRKRLPEIAEQRFPVELAVRYFVELLLEVGGKIILDIAAEEVLQKGDDQPAAILGNEAPLLELHIIAIL